MERLRRLELVKTTPCRKVEHSFDMSTRQCSHVLEDTNYHKPIASAVVSAWCDKSLQTGWSLNSPSHPTPSHTHSRLALQTPPPILLRPPR